MPGDSKPEISTPSPKAMTTREMHRALDTHSLKPFDVTESIRFCQAVNDLAGYIQLIPLPFDSFAVGLCYLEAKESGFQFVIANKDSCSHSTPGNNLTVAIMVGTKGGNDWTVGPLTSSLEDALATVLVTFLDLSYPPVVLRKHLLERLSRSASSLTNRDLMQFTEQIEAILERLALDRK